MRSTNMSITQSCAAAKREILPNTGQRRHKGLNNQCEVSHQPTRQRERQVRRFKSPRYAQRFLSAHAPINNLFRIRSFHAPLRDTAMHVNRHVQYGKKQIAPIMQALRKLEAIISA